MKHIKYPHSKLAIFLGAFVGGLLCFAFYKITGLQIAFLSTAAFVRQIADVICFAAFATFATVWISWLFAVLSSRSAQSENNLQSHA